MKASKTVRTTEYVLNPIYADGVEADWVETYRTPAEAINAAKALIDDGGISSVRIDKEVLSGRLHDDWVEGRGVVSCDKFLMISEGGAA